MKGNNLGQIKWQQEEGQGFRALLNTPSRTKWQQRQEERGTQLHQQLQISMSHSSCRGSETGEKLPLPPLYSWPKELDTRHKDGDVTKGLLMEVTCLCTAPTFPAGPGPASHQLGLG